MDPLEPTIKEILQEINSALDHKDRRSIDNLLFRLSSVWYLHDTGEVITDDEFEDLLTLLRREDFCTSGWYSRIPMDLVTAEFEGLSDTNRETLARTHADVFHRIEDAAAAISVCEMVGEMFRDMRSIGYLKEMADGASDVPRAAMPSGLLRLSYDPKPDTDTLEASVGMLLGMLKDDQYRDARGQALWALGIIRKELDSGDGFEGGLIKKINAVFKEVGVVEK